MTRTEPKMCKAEIQENDYNSTLSSYYCLCHPKSRTLPVRQRSSSYIINLYFLCSRFGLVMIFVFIYFMAIPFSPTCSLYMLFVSLLQTFLPNISDTAINATFWENSPFFPSVSDYSNSWSYYFLLFVRLASSVSSWHIFNYI